MCSNKRLLTLLCLCALFVISVACAFIPVAARSVTAADTLTAETQDDGTVVGSSVKAWTMRGTAFNVHGRDGDKEYSTTTSDKGYYTVVSVDKGELQTNPQECVAPGLKLTVDLEKYDETYVKVKYTLTNNGATSHEVDLGSYGEFWINDERVSTLWAEEKGGNTVLAVDALKKYAVRVIATTCDRIWYGPYMMVGPRRLADEPQRGPGYGYNWQNAFSYSWNATVAPGESWERYVLIGTDSAEKMSNGEQPTIQQPTWNREELYIELLSNDVYFVEGDELPDPSWWRGWHFLYSYNKWLVVYNIPKDTNTPGDYNVTYTVYRENKPSHTKDEEQVSTTMRVHILPKAAELAKTEVSQSTDFTLSSTMNFTGGMKWTETGFVYGVISKPTLSQNDGLIKTSSVVNTKGGKLTATLSKKNLVGGLQYYARAYAKASDGSVIYGDSCSNSFGIELPDYGTFNVKNNGNNSFTISRTNGSDGEQIVYYRTVNGSAIGGTHFTHKANELTFKAGETTKTVTVTENSVSAKYGSYSATAYSNANRTYQLEIYRVEGGATIGTSSATRTMTKHSSYTIAKSVYTTEVSKAIVAESKGTKGIRIADASKAQGAKDTTVNFLTSRYGTNYSNSSTFSNYYSGNVLTYLQNTCSNWLYRYEMYAYEEVQGWEHAYFGTKPLTDTFHEVGRGGSVSGIDGQLYACCFQLKNSSYKKYSFPNPYVSPVEGSDSPNSFNDGFKGSRIEVNKKNYVKPSINDTCYTYFSASGTDEDVWWINSLTSYALPYDTVGPKLLGVAPMAGGAYLDGDKVTIALVFDEIVDKENSSLTTASKITTNWGSFYYAGGADTNVLYFTGKVPANASATISVTALDCREQIKDMSKVSAIDAKGSTTVTIGSNAAPTVSISSLNYSGSLITGKITATNAVKIEYAWSTSSAVPTSGWVTANETDSVSVRTTRSTAGTYYLHARVTNIDGRRKTAYKWVKISSTPVTVSLTATANNSSWATEQTITLTRSPSNATVEVIKPDKTTETVSGSSFVATDNGVYTFKLTYNGESITRQVVIGKVDKNNPIAKIGDLPQNNYTERIKLNFSVGDAESGVKTVSAKWGSTAATLTKLADGSYSVISPDKSGSYTLIVSVTDNAGNTTDEKSKTYTLNLTAPALTVTETSKNNKGVTYSYSVVANGNKNVVVCLPDGTNTAASSGTFTLTEAGDYIITVSDAAGHFVSKTVTVPATVDGVSPEVCLAANDTTATDSITVTVAIGDAGGVKTATFNGATLATKNEGDGLYTGSFVVTNGGVYTVTATDPSGNKGSAHITVYKLINGTNALLKIAYSGVFAAMPAPVKSGYAFNGWYTAKSGGTKVESGNAVGGAYELYAQWTHTAHEGGKATCAKKAICSVCGSEYGELDSTNHTGIVTDKAKEPTCTKTGLTEGKHCSVCDTVIVVQTVVPAKGHSWDEGEITEEPGCETKGEKKFTCRVCNATKTEEIDAVGHTEVIDPAVAATCTETGLTEGKHCSVCNDILVAQTTILAKGHTEVTDPAKEPTCTKTGLTEGKHCSVCREVIVAQTVVPAKGHTEVIDPAVAATCTKTGLTEGKHCSVCDTVIVAQTVVDAKGHTEVTDPAVAATCTKTGLTEGKHCSVCNTVLVAQTVVAAKGHTEVVDPAVAATCTKSGKTAGKHCSVCNEVIVAQIVVPAKGHTEVTDPAVAATCTKPGKTAGKHCSVCNEVIVAQTEVPATGHSWDEGEITKAPECETKGERTFTCKVCDATKTEEIDAVGHTEVIDPAEEPTCTKSGKTAGKHCSVCNEVLVAQTVVPAKGHTEVVDPAVEPTCTKTGLTEGKHCSVCGAVLVAQTTIPATGHTEVIDPAEEPTCTKSGKTAGKHCSVCNEVLVAQTVVPAKGHTEVVDPAVEPTCTKTGLTEGKHCSVCGAVLVAQTTIPATGHTEVVDPAVEPTCTKPGKTAGKHCSVCNEVIVAQTVVPAKGHTEVTDPAVEPTCTKTGLTEGKHCSVCNEVLVAQTVVPVKGHTEVKDPAVEPTCTKPGKTAGKHCSVCNEVIVAQTTIPAAGHTEVVDPAVAATCTKTGLTEGKHCSVCNEVLVAQTVVAAKGHTEVIDPAVAATCTKTGLTEGKHCSVCNTVLVAQTVVPAKGHTEVTDPAVGATCTKSGKTAGKHCSVCNEVIVAQTVVPAKGHTEVTDPAVEPTCTKPGKTAGKHCSVCNEVLVAQTVVAAKGHTEVIDPAEEPTCTKPGKTAGKHCSVCNTVLVAQTEVPAKGHTEVTDPAVAATCTTPGKTEGKHCSACNTVLVAQNVVPAKGHTEVIDAAVAATCTTPGKTEGKHCSVCKEILVAQTTIPAAGHTEVVDPAVAATCTMPGKTEGKHCSVCKEILVAQTTIPAAGHTEVVDPAIAATCTTPGKTEGKHCSVCNEILVAQTVVPAKGHTEVTDPAVAATCTTPGKTEGKHCSVCNEILVAQTTIPAAGHTEVTDPAEEPTCTKPGKTAGKHCSVCNEVIVAQTVVPAKGHTEVTDPAEEPTCTKPGKTAGKHCSVCNEVIVAQTTIPAAGHTEVVDPAVAATCTKTGLTEGKHCSVCDTVIVAQTEVPATGHIYDNDEDTECNACGFVRVVEEVITPEIIEGKDGKWNTKKRNNLSFTTNVSSARFIGIKVDGVEIDESQYERQNDGTKIILSIDFLSTLSVGKHTISVLSKDGVAETEFTVEAHFDGETKTGNDIRLYTLLPLLLAVMIFFIFVMPYENSRQKKKNL